MTNDNYLIAFLTNYDGDEESLVKEAFCIYSPSMGSCIEREQSYNVVCNQDGQITAVAYACY